jgi:hypothetical protein
MSVSEADFVDETVEAMDNHAPPRNSYPPRIGCETRSSARNRLLVRLCVGGHSQLAED